MGAPPARATFRCMWHINFAAVHVQVGRSGLTRGHCTSIHLLFSGDSEICSQGMSVPLAKNLSVVTLAAFASAPDNSKLLKRSINSGPALRAQDRRGLVFRREADDSLVLGSCALGFLYSEACRENAIELPFLPSTCFYCFRERICLVLTKTAARRGRKQGALSKYQSHLLAKLQTRQ